MLPFDAFQQALPYDAFLAKYRFSKAREYFLIHKGKRYDSKAIAGASHGFLPGKTALAASAFSGGEKTVKAKLESLVLPP